MLLKRNSCLDYHRKTVEQDEVHLPAPFKSVLYLYISTWKKLDKRKFIYNVKVYDVRSDSLQSLDNERECNSGRTWMCNRMMIEEGRNKRNPFSRFPNFSCQCFLVLVTNAFVLIKHKGITL